MSIPVTILGGFLGAGKTTALNHLLRDAQDRVGVLVNDFGAVNVDAQLVQSRDGEVMSLTNGCVCCSIGSDLSVSLAAMLERAPDRIVIEASGVSDPWRIAQLVKLEPGVVLEAVPVLVDATQFTTHLADPWLTDTLERQLARADLVALAKCDLADAAQREATRAAVQRIRPDAGIVEISGALPAMLLRGMPDIPSASTTAEAHDFRTWHWGSAEPLDRVRLQQALDGLPDSVLRAKGFVRIGLTAAPHLLQLVGRRWSLLPWDGAAESGLVLIGTDRLPPPQALATRFDATRLTPCQEPPP